MNRKATGIGQILTSFPSMILVFLLLLIFIIIAGFFSNGSSTKNPIPPASPESRALLEIFLNKKVLPLDVGIEGFDSKETTVKSLLGAVLDSSSKGKIASDYVQKLFHETYSCNGENKLTLVRFYMGKNTKIVFIDYPLSYNNPAFPTGEIPGDFKVDCVSYFASLDMAGALISEVKGLGNVQGSVVCVAVDVEAIC